MSDDNWDVLDPPRSKLRSLVAKLDQHISKLDSGSGQVIAADQVASLAGAWRELSKTLDLGEEPTLRACPHCRRRIPTQASRCRYCMVASPSAVTGHVP
jgi:hypothetical protein